MNSLLIVPETSMNRPAATINIPQSQFIFVFPFARHPHRRLIAGFGHRIIFASSLKSSPHTTSFVFSFFCLFEMLSQWNRAIERNHEVFIFRTLSFQALWLPFRVEPFQANSVDRFEIKLC